MQLTGLESVLLGGLIVSASAFFTAMGKELLFKRSIRDISDKYLSQSMFERQTEVCKERFDRADNETEETRKEVARLSAMFERFIIFSDIPLDTKQKIINGGGVKSNG